MINDILSKRVGVRQYRINEIILSLRQFIEVRMYWICHNTGLTLVATIIYASNVG